jgi:hypothetical protein
MTVWGQRWHVASSNGGETRRLFIQLFQKVLDRINFAFLEIGFAALAADPRGNGFERQMVSFAVDMKGCVGRLHRSPAMHTPHAFFLVRNCDHPRLQDIPL